MRTVKIAQKYGEDSNAQTILNQIDLLKYEQKISHNYKKKILHAINQVTEMLLP